MLVASAMAAAVGCATADERRGDELAEQGQYLRAAGAYEDALDHEPGVARVRQKRDDARVRALNGLLLQAREDRRRGRPKPAVARLEIALQSQREWHVALSPGTQRVLGEEIAAATADVRDDVGHLLDARRPLAAAAAMKKHHPLFAEPELAAIVQRLATLVQQAGQQTCQALRGTVTPETPNWSNLSADYCTKLGIPTPRVPLPRQSARLTVGGVLAGVPPGDQGLEPVQATIDRTFRHSPWFDATGDSPSTATLAGRLNADWRTRPVTQNIPWTENVAYPATESYQQPYTEFYNATETYLASVPYMASESYTYSCGFGTTPRTCTGTRMVSRTRSEMRTRLVPRTRTAYRTAWRTVTRYRPEARVFVLRATEHLVDYALDLSLTAHLPGVEQPVRVELSARDHAQGLEHATTFGPAHIEPQTANLPSGAAWLNGQLPALAHKLGTALQDAWRANFCDAAGTTLEEAARCVRGAPAPPWARELFAGVTGDDLTALAGALTAVRS